jgi:hypothetical protein
MLIRITRDIFTDTFTLGTVYLDFEDGSGKGFLPFAFSVEDVDRRVEEDLARKVKGSTAIPTGSYRVHLYNSPKHGPNTPELLDVPGFKHIQVHSGSSAVDSAGCLLLGLKRDVQAGKVLESRKACRWLNGRIFDTIQSGVEVWVEVTRI